MPEEINRVLTDHVSMKLMCPTQTAVDNLHYEGIAASIHMVGDVMYDAALHYGAKSEAKSLVLAKYGLDRKGYILVTIHRAENTDDPQRLENIMVALENVARDIRLVLPLHPRTRKKLQALDSSPIPHLSSLITFLDPVGYLDMVMLEKNARLVVTDSGGVQKEAYFHAVPCVTLREETEWVELVQAGWNTLCPPFDPDRIQEAIHQALGARCALQEQLYGDGNAGQKIVDLLAK
jgi:UDP-GlcNAc3NAcA epimerase